ncbi:MAG: c-type cytochrome [Sulfuricella sp.]
MNPPKIRHSLANVKELEQGSSCLKHPSSGNPLLSASENSAGLSEFQIAISCFACGILLALLVAILAPLVWNRHELIPDEDAIAERIRPLGDLVVAPLAATAIRGQRTGAVLVQEFCQSCHGKGINGAPKIGDRKAWTPRLDKGLDALMQSVIAGKCSMPPRGGSDANQMELARAIVYLIWPRMRL